MSDGIGHESEIGTSAAEPPCRDPATVNPIRIAIVVLVALCVWIAWPKGDAVPPRPLLIKAALKQVDDPVIILGDSIVEYATLPHTACGRSIINAGIAGSTTASNLPDMLNKALAGKKAAMIVVSLGLNDATASFSAEKYRTNYQAILAELAPSTRRLGIMAVTSAETSSPTRRAELDAVIASYNIALRSLAIEHRATFIAPPQMPTPHTVDGIHLNPAGYAVWFQALLSGIETSLCKKA